MANSTVPEQFYTPSAKNIGSQKREEGEENYEETYQKHRELMLILPKAKGWMTEYLLQYQGFWLKPMDELKGVLLLQNHFKPRPSDIFLATFPKCGTTWLKALVFATMHRFSFDFSNHPLLNTGPHGCIPFLEVHIYKDYPVTNVELLASPRLFATHLAYHMFPENVISSGCKFVYLCREPKDVLISKWYFMAKLRPKELPPLSLREAFELFCEGVSDYGPFWDQVLVYWKASLESPDKVLFLKYEDLRREPSMYLKRLAEFMGQPFSLEEEEKGVVQEILKLCSFENLTSLVVNKTGVHRFSPEIVINNRDFFRKGQIGDWESHLTVEMKEKLDRITEQKFMGSGLTLGTSS
ncbi:hypothetical protein RJ640_026122 [Escallonia rubra]|uniref:Sulfotransferase n=1 Tax=Escallonia rubra TaxID=112253 RepID=A0AA88RU11_9ASTE|nr:hypothetical protein RJ640_026122 [Escallonia rubra]